MTTFYIAELTEIFDRPITTDIAKQVSAAGNFPIETIGCREMTCENGAIGWGAFLLRHTTNSRDRAETAARWLARGTGKAEAVYIFTDWQNPLDWKGGKP